MTYHAIVRCDEVKAQVKGKLERCREALEIKGFKNKTSTWYATSAAEGVQ